jgi:hypothetical protein
MFGQSEPAFFTYSLRQPNPGMQRSRASSHAARPAGRRIDGWPLLTVVSPLCWGSRGRREGAAWLRLSARRGIVRHWRVIHATTVRFRVPTSHDKPQHRRFLTGDSALQLWQHRHCLRKGLANTVLLKEAAGSGPIAEADAQWLRTGGAQSQCRNSRAAPLFLHCLEMETAFRRGLASPCHCRCCGQSMASSPPQISGRVT